MGLGLAHAGAQVQVYANLEIGFVCIGSGWKMAHFLEGADAAAGRDERGARPAAAGPTGGR